MPIIYSSGGLWASSSSQARRSAHGLRYQLLDRFCLRVHVNTGLARNSGQRNVKASHQALLAVGGNVPNASYPHLPQVLDPLSLHNGRFSFGVKNDGQSNANGGGGGGGGGSTHASDSC